MVERAVMFPQRYSRHRYPEVVRVWNPTDPDDPYWPEECAKVAEKPKTKAGLQAFWECHPELRGCA